MGAMSCETTTRHSLQSLVGGRLSVRGQLAFPETATREAHVPVGELVGDEILDERGPALVGS